MVLIEESDVEVRKALHANNLHGDAVKMPRVATAHRHGAAESRSISSTDFK